MKLKDNLTQLFNGFSKLNRQERLSRLVEMGALTLEDIEFLNKSTGIKTEFAEHFIENVLGYFQLPLGVAVNMRIDGKDIPIPMAVEETSIIAALSKTAKWVRDSGEIITESVGDCAIGQLQIARARNFDSLKETLLQQKEYLMHFANEHAAQNLVRRGGGVKDIEIRALQRPDGDVMAVIHVLVDTCDAMGANLINQICESLREPIENITDEKVNICILSNLNDRKLTRAKIRIKNIDVDLGKKIEEASIFAECDPYRAATHNKGVLNGIDPILIATGNDWRAVEAGIHAYACRDGQYRSITKWRMQGKDLVGIFEAPISVGTVGGVTALHPTAKIALKMLDITHANELARIAAAVGLVQNLGALSALVTVGIIQGHMKLHISNLALSAGASEAEKPLLQKRLEEILKMRKAISLTHAIEALNALRNELTVL